MGSAASLLPASDEEALARGFTQDQINQFKQALRQHPRSHLQRPQSVENSSSRSTVFANAGLSSLEHRVAPSRQLAAPVYNEHRAPATIPGQPRPSQRTSMSLPRPVFANSAAGVSAASASSATSVTSATSTAPAASVPSASLGFIFSVTFTYTIKHRWILLHLLRHTNVLSQGHRPANSLLSNWLSQARQKIQKKKTTQKSLNLGWFRFDKHVRALYTFFQRRGTSQSSNKLA